MRHVNVTGPAFQPTMRPEDNHERDLRDEVAKIAYTAMVQELGTNAEGLEGDVIPVVAKTVAKVSFDFADAFMRERYERESIARAEMQANIPDHLGQLNL